MKLLFLLAHMLNEPSFYSTYKMLIKNQWKPYQELVSEQEKALRKMIAYAYQNVPYYHDLFKCLQLKPEDIKTIKDLERLPILTKEIIKKNWDKFIPKNIDKIRYSIRSTGGSTGAPFKYRLDRYNHMFGVAINYRGWSYGGYNLDDKVVVLGGASVGVSKKPKVMRKIDAIVRNRRYLSSFDMDTSSMKSYVETINRFKPKYMYGYASSFYFFANWLEQNKLEVFSPKAIFTTAEKLFPHMRKKIETVFNTQVYDTYGLNDGCVSAFECSEHTGLHIDTERAVMEIVDDDGHQMQEGKGKIIATSLYNFSLPFIRYDTGDIGHITGDKCGCGREYRLLKEVVGRQQEILQTPDGKYIHGEFFTHIFWEIEHVKEFQVIQETLDTIVIKIVPEEGFDEKSLEIIRKMIGERSRNWNIEFKLVDTIERTNAGKYKFVINKMGLGK